MAGIKGKQLNPTVDITDADLIVRTNRGSIINSRGWNVTLTASIANATALNSGYDGGDIELNAGAAAVNGTGIGVGGDIVMRPALGAGGGDDGAVVIENSDLLFRNATDYTIHGEKETVPGTAGASLAFSASEGADGSGATAGAAGGQTQINGATGGAGGATSAGGAGGATLITGGSGGAVGGTGLGGAGGDATFAGGPASGNANGGDCDIRAGAKAGSGSHGILSLGDINTSIINVGAPGVRTAFAGPPTLPLHTVAAPGLPSATVAGQLIYVSDAAGGAVPAFSDGTNWLRVTDRTVVT